MDFEQNVSKPKFYGTLKDRQLLPRLLGHLALFTVWIVRGGRILACEQALKMK
jgi:hypothetical protein